MIWTQPEINDYLGLRTKYNPLEKFYEENGIEESDVEKKSKYLIENVLNLTMTDEDLLNRTVHNEGRARGLIFLEELVKSSNEEFIRQIKNKINTPTVSNI